MCQFAVKFTSNSFTREMNLVLLKNIKKIKIQQEFKRNKCKSVRTIGNDIDMKIASFHNF